MVCTALCQPSGPSWAVVVVLAPAALAALESLWSLVCGLFGAGYDFVLLSPSIQYSSVCISVRRDTVLWKAKRSSSPLKMDRLLASSCLTTGDQSTQFRQDGDKDRVASQDQNRTEYGFIRPMMGTGGGVLEMSS